MNSAAASKKREIISVTLLQINGEGHRIKVNNVHFKTHQHVMSHSNLCTLNPFDLKVSQNRFVVLNKKTSSAHTLGSQYIQKTKNMFTVRPVTGTEIRK